MLLSTLHLGWQLVALLSSWGASHRVQTVTVGLWYCPVVAGCRFARHLLVCMLRYLYISIYIFFTGRRWVGAWKVCWGVSVPLPPCSRAHRSSSTMLGGRGLVVAAHRVVMVTLRARLLCSRLHYLSRHLPQAHLLLMSLNVVKCNLS